MQQSKSNQISPSVTVTPMMARQENDADTAMDAF